MITISRCLKAIHSDLLASRTMCAAQTANGMHLVTGGNEMCCRYASTVATWTRNRCPLDTTVDPMARCVLGGVVRRPLVCVRHATIRVSSDFVYSPQQTYHGLPNCSIFSLTDGCTCPMIPSGDMTKSESLRTLTPFPQ